MSSTNNFNEQGNLNIIDPVTLWLLRTACIVIILFFTSLIVLLPFSISIVQSQIDTILFNIKGFLKQLIEIYLI